MINGPSGNTEVMLSQPGPKNELMLSLLGLTDFMVLFIGTMCDREAIPWPEYIVSSLVLSALLVHFILLL
jgi:hypothetical protein